MNAAPPLLGHARIVTVEEARQLVESGGVSILDAREAARFQQGHLPSSQAMDWRDWTEERPGLVHYLLGHPERWGRIPKADEHLQERLRSYGLDNDRPILVVGEPHRWGEEGRIAWNLLFWGAKDVALLDGGLDAWQRAGLSIESGEPRPVPRGHFTVVPQMARLAELADVRQALKSKQAVFLDARELDEWQGRTVRAQKRGGHLPGARLVAHHEVYQADGHYVDAEGLRARVGLVDASSTPIAYCVGGVRSALLAVVLEARLGVLVRNYAGSIWEYATEEELPLT